MKSDPMARQRVRGRLFRKYVALFVAVVSVALAANGLLDIWFTYQEQSALLIAMQRGASPRRRPPGSASLSKEIETQIGWITQLPWSATTVEEWRFDAVRLLRQVPAMTEVAQLDPSGHEQVRVSRGRMDVIGSETDFSRDPIFVEAWRTRSTTDRSISFANPNRTWRLRWRAPARIRRRRRRGESQVHLGRGVPDQGWQAAGTPMWSMPMAG